MQAIAKWQYPTSLPKLTLTVGAKQDMMPLPYELVINNAQTSPFHVTSTLQNPGHGLFPKQLIFAVDSPVQQTWNCVQPNLGGAITFISGI